MRVCSKCEIGKPTTDFYVKDSKSGRLHTQCKECYKEHRKTYYAVHYEKYKEEYRTRARAQRAKLTNEYHTNILEYLSVRACVIC